MKRQIVRIEDISNIKLLHEGWKNATKGDKYWRKSTHNYEVNLDNNLRSLSHRLREGTWRPSSGHTFRMMTEGKWRDITSFPIEDRIVHYAVVHVFNMSRHFIRRTHGSIKGRGCLSASKQVRKDIRNISHRVEMLNKQSEKNGKANEEIFEVTVVKYDCKKFYPSILKSRLKEKILRKYKGEAAIALLFSIIDAYMPDSERGMSIGALTSQDMGNFFLTMLDLFALENIRTHYYNRYVDDITTLRESKAQAIAAIPRMVEAAEKDGIIFGRIEVYPLRVRRVDFCGYAVGMLNGTLSTRMRPKTVRRYCRRLHVAANHLAAMRADTPSQRATVLGGFAAESLRQTIASYEGIALHADTHNLLINLKRNYYEIFRTSDREPDCSRHERERVATA